MKDWFLTEEDRSRYWDKTYSATNSDLFSPPSQFAAFIAQEVDRSDLILELGCGTGRDSFFFAKYGMRVVAVDGSAAAVKKCQDKATSLEASGIKFFQGVVGDPDLESKLCSFLPLRRDFKLMVYARFFLHAINEEEENALLAMLARITKAGDRCAFEYRTKRDASLTKVTEKHYRRFVDPIIFYSKAVSKGYVIDYAVEGFGFAKYREDDAFVARCILRNGNSNE
jgi:SAM-dependent methyltransferase